MIHKGHFPQQTKQGGIAEITAKCYLADLNDLAASYIFLGKVPKDGKVSAKFIKELNKNRRMSYTFTEGKLDCDFIKNNEFMLCEKEKATQYLFYNSIVWLNLENQEYIEYLYSIFLQLADIKPTPAGKAMVAKQIERNIWQISKCNINNLITCVVNKKIETGDSVDSILYPKYSFSNGVTCSRAQSILHTLFRFMLQRIITTTDNDTVLVIDDIYSPTFVAALFETIFPILSTRQEVLNRLGTYYHNLGKTID